MLSSYEIAFSVRIGAIEAFVYETNVSCYAEKELL